MINKAIVAAGLLLLLGGLRAEAQRRDTYTVLQAGGLFGVAGDSDQPLMHGYQFQFVFGRNFYDRMFLGLGIGSDVYRGRSYMEEGRSGRRRGNTLPIFADFRVPFTSVGPLGVLGGVVDAGYAPSIGADYFKGFLGKAGLTYSHLLVEGSWLQFSAGYGFQQFNPRYAGHTFAQHNVFVTVGLFVH